MRVGHLHRQGVRDLALAVFGKALVRDASTPPRAVARVTIPTLHPRAGLRLAWSTSSSARLGYLTAIAPIRSARRSPAGEEPEMKMPGSSSSGSGGREAELRDRVVVAVLRDRLSRQQTRHDPRVLDGPLVALVVRGLIAQRRKVVLKPPATMFRYSAPSVHVSERRDHLGHRVRVHVRGLDRHQRREPLGAWRISCDTSQQSTSPLSVYTSIPSHPAASLQRATSATDSRVHLGGAVPRLRACREDRASSWSGIAIPSARESTVR